MSIKVGDTVKVIYGPFTMIDDPTGPVVEVNDGVSFPLVVELGGEHGRTNVRLSYREVSKIRSGDEGAGEA